MKFELPPQQRLNEAEAHEEANMMRVKLGVDPEFGWKENGRMPTAEDYDRALKVVEKMKRMAEKEPLTKKVLIELARLATKSAFGLYKGFAFIASGPWAGDIAAREAGREEEGVLNKLDDAASDLRKLKAEAEEFGKQENED